jgi:hypothetical protein
VIRISQARKRWDNNNERLRSYEDEPCMEGMRKRDRKAGEKRLETKGGKEESKSQSFKRWACLRIILGKPIRQEGLGSSHRLVFPHPATQCRVSMGTLSDARSAYLACSGPSGSWPKFHTRGPGGSFLTPNNSEEALLIKGGRVV